MSERNKMKRELRTKMQRFYGRRIIELEQRLAAAEAAARILLDELSQFTRVEWLLERWPWLKDEAEKMGGCDE